MKYVPTGFQIVNKIVKALMFKGVLHKFVPNDNAITRMMESMHIAQILTVMLELIYFLLISFIL